jgi:hypothetical protein
LPEILLGECASLLEVCPQSVKFGHRVRTQFRTVMAAAAWAAAARKDQGSRHI